MARESPGYWRASYRSLTLDSRRADDGRCAATLGGLSLHKKIAAGDGWRDGREDLISTPSTEQPPTDPHARLLCRLSVRLSVWQIPIEY